MADTERCVHCGLTIKRNGQGAWVHVMTGTVWCAPVTRAAPA